jgi:hypothetical protein
VSKYLEGFRAFMQGVADSIDKEENPHHKAILANYLQHAALEFSHRAAEIFTPEMTVADPQYHVRIDDGDVADYDGMDAVKGYYAAVNEEIIMLNDETHWVSDWGLATYSTLVRVARGERLLGSHDAVDDPDAMYAEHYLLGMFWPYDDHARLLGEHVYQLEPAKAVKLADDEVVTLEQRMAVAAEFVR